MANTFRLKRSAVQGKVPTTGDLQLGELALNTYDGKLYTLRDNGTSSVVEIGGSSGVSSFSAGSTGLTPSTSSTGAVTLGGTLAVANGGTGVTTSTGTGSVVRSASPTFTGTPIAPTAAVGTNTTQIATTAFVNAEIANDAPSKTGTGASGTWGISITGAAASATTATNQSGGTVSATTGSFTGDVTQTGSGALRVANGTTAQRPTGANGHIRYNTTLGALESFVQGAWQVIANNSLDYGLITSAADTTFDYGALV